MKRIYILPIAALAIVGTFSFKKSEISKIEKFISVNGHNVYAGGAPAGKTGAPGEANCTGCHSGTAQNGSSENILTVLSGSTPVTSYTPGSTYTVALVMASNPAKKGFQATALGSSNTMAGTFVASTNTSINGTTKKYANHKSTSNTSATTAWGWTWTAPATDMGDVTFYVATNIANNNNNDTGDAIYLSQHVLTSTAGLVEETQEDANFSAGYSSSNNMLIMNFTTFSAGEMSINLVDMNGKSVFNYNLGNAIIGENKEKIVLPADIRNGIYIVNFFVNNQAMSSKIMIQK